MSDIKIKCPVCHIIRRWLRIRRGRSGNLLSHSFYCPFSRYSTRSTSCFVFVLPQIKLALCPRSLCFAVMCVSDQLCSTKEERQRGWYFLICKPSTYFLPCNMWPWVSQNVYLLGQATLLLRISSLISFILVELIRRLVCCFWLEHIIALNAILEKVSACSYSNTVKNTACSQDKLPPMGERHFITRSKSHLMASRP